MTTRTSYASQMPSTDKAFAGTGHDPDAANPDCVTLTECSEACHAEAILAILNHAIETSTAIYDYKPRPMSAMTAWFRSRHEAGIPVIGLENKSGQLLGFTTWGPFRPFAAFKYAAEHSLYVHENARGQGLGSKLMQELVSRAQHHQLHCLIAGIDSSNQASIGLHLRSGFKHVGTITEAGYKFGHWRDLAFYQLLLKTPEQPIEN